MNLELEAANDFFSSSQFMPHGHCYLWKPALLWVNSGSDILIFLSYMAISSMLVYLVVKLKAIPFHVIYILFGTFIFACGLTHLMEIINIWEPFYWTSGFLKIITAIASVGTAIALPSFYPKIVILLQNTELLRVTEGKLADDIEERKLIEENLKTAVASAEKANSAKSEFLANMSHEIRTPMHIIIGMAQILEESPLSDEQKKQVNMFKKAGNSLLNIINDLLDISKIESGNLSIDKIEISLKNIVEDIADLCSPKAVAKKIEIAFNIDENTPQNLRGDDFRIKQILINLVGNAIKFTEQGFVSINVGINTDQTKKGNIYFSVTDSGIGISEEQRQNLFQPFSQANASITRNYGGTGLGLAISKRLVELMGGEIWLVSEEGVGTTFFFTLDCEVSNLSTRPALKAVPSKDKIVLPDSDQVFRVLLVDDLEENRILLKAFLRNTKHIITEADNGEVAVAKAKSERFDIILMDMQMPILDGYAATRQIREWEAQQGKDRIPIIALTAYALVEEKLKSIEVGCDKHLAKPVKKIDLMQIFNEFSIKRSG